MQRKGWKGLKSFMLEGKNDHFFPWLSTLTVSLFNVHCIFRFICLSFSMHFHCLLFLFTTGFSSVIFSVQLYWWESHVVLCVVLDINYNVVILIHKLVNGFRKFMQLLAWAGHISLSSQTTLSFLFTQQLRKFINTFHPQPLTSAPALQCIMFGHPFSIYCLFYWLLNAVSWGWM